MKVSILSDSERKEIINILITYSLKYNDRRPGLDDETSLRYYFNVLSDEFLYIKYNEIEIKKETV